MLHKNIKTRILTVFVCAASIMLSGCTSFGLFLANLPASFEKDQMIKNVAYGDQERQKLDIYLPTTAQKKDKNTPSPTLLFFYGGRWSSGDKSQYEFLANRFTQQGYIVALSNYRHYPNVKFPAFVEDAAAAYAYLYNNIEKHDGDKRNIFVAGHSAGAHIGALIASDPQYLAAHNIERDTIAGFIGLSGPYAFEPEADDLKDMFGPPDRYPLMRAPNFVDGNQPPMLLLHGLKDTTVVLENAQKLKDAIREKGGEVSLITYENLNHIETIGSLIWFWSYKSSISDDMLKFMNTHIRKDEKPI